jgi:tetratricopeptide (TPR) repeat protein
VLSIDPDALAWARQALATGLEELPDPLPFAAETVAWAVKDACNEAWGSAPVQLPVGLALLGQLLEREPTALFRALHAWMHGLALIREGALDAALGRLATAETALQSLDRPLSAAQTLVPRMVALGMGGRLDEALALGHEAVGRFLALEDEVSAGKVEVNLGSLLGRADRYPEAVPLLRRAAIRFARARQLGPSIAADIALANALTWLHQFDEALRVHARALMRAKAHGFTGYRALASGAIGRLELMRGRYQKSLAALVEASRLHTEAGSAPQLRIDAESALADGYLSVNLLPEAERLYGAVVARAREFHAPVEEAHACMQRALVRVRRGDLAAASADLERARLLYAEQRNATAMAQADLVQTRVLLASHRADAALALALARGACQILANSAISALRLEAQALLAAALAACSERDEARRWFETTAAEAAALPPVRVQCHLGLAELALVAGDETEAAAQLQAVMTWVGLEQEAMLSDEARIAVWHHAERAQELMLTLRLRQGADGHALAACIEDGRGRVLPQASRQATPAGAQDEPFTRLRWVQQSYREALAGGDSLAAARHAAEVAAIEQSLLEARRREQLLRPGRRDAEDLDAGPELVRRSLGVLPAGTAIVTWQELERSGEPCLVACVLHDGRVAYRCAPASDWLRRLQSLRFQIDALRLGALLQGPAAAEALRRVRSHLQALHSLIWKPIEDLLGGVERVVLVPHRSLHYLPFAALHDGQQSLADRHEFSLVPSLRLWLALQQAPEAARLGPAARALVVGHGGQHLPHVSHEVQAVARLFGGGATVLDGPGATRGAVQQALSDQPVQILHLACHGQFRADSPSFSSLEMADGALTLLDAQALPLRGALVTLSACDTGQSAQAPGNELVGLVRGFLAAGARTVVSTLWTVDDESTAELMGQFYRGLLQGQRPAEALRGAQRRLARDQPHPFHWAAFTVSGLG